jgi:thiamine-monophosphate kinase
VTTLTTEAPVENDLDTLSEFRLIERLFARHVSHGQQRDDVSLGIGDDAAITRLLPDDFGPADLVTTTDMLLEGTHFLPGAPARSVGHRCLAINLSDIAAMGGTPLWASMALSLPEVNDQWLDEFAAGFFALADACGVELIGGDTVRGPLAVTVTVQGRVPHGTAVLRSGAAVGDLVYVTGEPGAAAAGRLLLRDANKLSDNAKPLADTFLYPEPRLQVGMELRSLVSAMIDVSDGLHADLKHLLVASAKGALLDGDELRLHSNIEQSFSHAQAIELALCGGEDYELLFTVPPQHVAKVHELAEGWACRLACIGVITAGDKAEWRLGGDLYAVPTSGYRHF